MVFLLISEMNFVGNGVFAPLPSSHIAICRVVLAGWDHGKTWRRGMVPGSSLKGGSVYLW